MSKKLSADFVLGFREDLIEILEKLRNKGEIEKYFFFEINKNVSLPMLRGHIVGYNPKGEKITIQIQLENEEIADHVITDDLDLFVQGQLDLLKVIDDNQA